MIRNYKQFYALLNQQSGIDKIGVNAMKFDLANQFSEGRTRDIKELKDSEYSELIKSLRQNSNKGKRLNSWRKRVIASIFGFFELTNKETTITYVKAIAVRAAGSKCNGFNDISEPKLRAIYNEFLRQQEIVKRIGLEKALLEINPSLLAMCGIEIKVNKHSGTC
jgi:site-specific recombinase XerD